MHLVSRTRKLLIVDATTILLLLLAACGSRQAPEAPAVEAGDDSSSEVGADETNAGGTGAENDGPITIETEGEVPFYARFGENERFGDGEQVVIVFYRSPDCVPPDFNMNQFFHFPGEEGPGAFACTPTTTTAVETWANDPETDPAPLESEMTGRGEVPIWFFSDSDIAASVDDGVVTIGELRELPSRRVGTASAYEELLHPSQSNEQSLVQIQASGTLEDGGDFTVDISYGDPDVEDHVTIETGG